jgi:hypothetical protein
MTRGIFSNRKKKEVEISIGMKKRGSGMVHKMDSFENIVLDKLEKLAVQVGILVNDMKDVKSTQGDQKTSIEALKTLWAKTQTIEDAKKNFATKEEFKSFKIQFGVVSLLVLGAAGIILRTVFESLVNQTIK